MAWKLSILENVVKNFPNAFHKVYFFSVKQKTNGFQNYIFTLISCQEAFDNYIRI